TTLSAVAGGRANEVYVGYDGYNGPDPYQDTPEQNALGNGDRVTYDPSSKTLTNLRYQFKCTHEHAHCWEDRSVRRILYARTGAAAGHAFFGFNHGTAHVFNDVIGDHVHPEMAWVMGTTVNPHYGEQRGLAIDDGGMVWTASRYGVGQMNWNP